MPQEPFTPAGVQQKQADLYELSDELLGAEVNLIKSDLREWLSDNFSFTADQGTYLGGIDDRWIEGLAGALAFAIINRNEINLTYEGTLPSSKIVRYEDKANPRWAPSGDGFSIAGSLDIIFSPAP